MRAAVRQRRADLDEVRASRGALDGAERRVERAESARDLAIASVDGAATRLAERHRALDAVRHDWRERASAKSGEMFASWRAAFGEGSPGAIASLARGVAAGGPPPSDAAVGFPTDADTPTPDTVAPDGDEPTLHAALAREADALIEHHRDAVTTLDARLDVERRDRDEVQVRVDTLAARDEPDPPRLDWQRPADHTLADLVDFAPHLDDEARAGLEAGLQASGLLSARVVDGAALALDSGELVAIAGDAVPSPLGELLIVTVPERLAADVDATLVKRLLGSISSDPSSAGANAIAPDGRFRVGALAGRHAKPRAELVGAGARREALERERARAAEALEAARAIVSASEREREHRAGERDAARRGRDALPGLGELVAARADVSAASAELDRLDGERTAAARRVGEAERASIEASNALQRLATTLALPGDLAALDAVTDDLVELAAALDRAVARLDALARSLGDWRDAAERWRTVVADLEEARATANAADAGHAAEAARLETIEGSVGVAYAEVLERRDRCVDESKAADVTLRECREARDAALSGVAAAEAALERAAEERVRSEHACEEARRTLTAALSVPGLRDALTVFPEADGDASNDKGDPDDVAGPPAPTVPTTPGVDGLRELLEAVERLVAGASRTEASGEAGARVGRVGADGVRQSLRQRRDALGAGWDADALQPDPALPLAIEVDGPSGRAPLAAAGRAAFTQHANLAALLDSRQDDALRELLQGLIAREVAEKVHGAERLVELMNARLATVRTSHQVGVRLRWRRSPELDPATARLVELLATVPDLRTAEDERELRAALSARLADERAARPDVTYRELIADTLDYTRWHEMSVMLGRADGGETKLGRRTPLSEGEKKLVTYLPLFAAVAASCDSLAERHAASDGARPGIARFVLLDDAFAKVSEDNHPALFGLLVALDLDLIATSERLWGTHANVPELAITEVVRDAEAGVILLEHYRWDGHTLERRDGA